jgi:predicted PurR-regulated permease PerM
LFLIALGVSIALLYYGRLFFVTLVVAITIGFLLDPFVELLMRIRLPRSVGSFVVCVVALLLLYLAGLAAYTQVAVLISDLPTYSGRINELVDRLSAQLEQTERRAYELLVPKRLQNLEPAPPSAARPGLLPASADPRSLCRKRLPPSRKFVSAREDTGNLATLSPSELVL